MKPWLFVGAKVVCVEASGVAPPGDPLVKGAIYTVREIMCGGNGVTLIEVDHGDGWIGFQTRRFRPVSTIDTTKTIEALRKLTRDAMQKVDA